MRKIDYFQGRKEMVHHILPENGVELDHEWRKG